MRSKEKERKRLRLLVKTTLSLSYLLIIGILCFVSFRLYEQDQKIVKWKDVEKTSQYSYIEISEMSEAFAEITGENKTVHFVIEKEETGAWHTYLIAIKKEDYKKYKRLIDYTYERINELPEKVKVYGYPVLISKEIKNIAIKNIGNFVPVENKIVLNEENFEQYITNTYLDTTKEKIHRFNHIILSLLLIALSLGILLVFTIFDKDKIVDEVDEIIEKEEKRRKSRKKKKNQLEKRKQTTPSKKQESKIKTKEEKKSTSQKKKLQQKTQKEKKESINKGKKEEKEEEIEIL